MNPYVKQGGLKISSSVKQNGSISGLSDGTVTANLNCISYNVTTLPSSQDTTIAYDYNNKTRAYDIHHVAPADSAIYIYDTSASSYGARCATINAYQPYGSEARFYICENTVSIVSGTVRNILAVQLSDLAAKQVAAAIALRGELPAQPSWLYESYDKDYLWIPDIDTSYETYASEEAVACEISLFFMSTIAAADQGYISISDMGSEAFQRVIVTCPLREPYYPNYLQVTWSYAVAILVVIPILQLIALLIVTAYA